LGAIIGSSGTRTTGRAEDDPPWDGDEVRLPRVGDVDDVDVSAFSASTITA
jgi:hypothetical protein